MICEECGQTCERNSSQQRWCPACRPAMRLRQKAAQMRERRTRDPSLAAYQKAWNEAHSERRQAYQDKCYHKPCPRCGKVRHVSRVGKQARETLLCGKCWGLTQRKATWRRCYWCQGFFMRLGRGLTAPAPRHWCSECYGIMTRIAPLLGVTRERVRQLVNEEYAHLNQDGHWATRAEALASVMTARRGDA